MAPRLLLNSRLLPCFVCLLLISSFQPNRGHALDLKSLLKLAYLNDATYLSELEEIASQKTGTWQSWAAMGPQVDIAAERSLNENFLRLEVEPPAVAESGEQESEVFERPEQSARYYENRLRAVLSQPLIDIGKFIDIKKSAKERKKMALLLQKADEALILKVADRYFSVLNAEDALRLAEAERSSLQEQAAFAVQRYDLGVGTIIDKHDAEARFHLAQAREIAARDALEESWSHLDEWITPAGRAARFLLPLADIQPMEFLHDDPTFWVEKAYQNNVSLNLRSVEARILGYERKIIRSSHFPTLAFNLEQIYTEANGSLAGPGRTAREYAYSLQANLPLYRNGATILAASQAKQKQMAAEKRVEATRHKVERDTKTAWRTAKTNRLLIRALLEAVEAGKKAVAAKEIGYLEGNNTSLDVIDAQRIYYQDLREYQKARYQYIMAYLELKQMAGELVQEDLTRINLLRLAQK